MSLLTIPGPTHADLERLMPEDPTPPVFPNSIDLLPGVADDTPLEFDPDPPAPGLEDMPEMRPGMIMPDRGPLTYNPIEWLETCRYLDNRPISFDKQPWIVNMLMESDRWQVWQTGRQIAKSTSLVNLMLAFGCNVRNLRQLYVAPTYNQARLFSSDRLRPAILESPPIHNNYWSKRCTDQVRIRSLSTGSQMLMAHCFHSADSVRGASSHVLMLDELQDLMLETVIVLEETLSAAERMEMLPGHEDFVNVRRYCGTPKSFETALQHFWDRSTQNEWFVPCRSCGGADLHYWNVLGDKNVAQEGLVCDRCGKPIDWVEGEWVMKYPDAMWTGWHVSQLMATKPHGWIEWDSIWDKKVRYLPHLFANEVLGIAFDSGMRPVSLDQIKACCLQEYSLGSIRKGVHKCYAGIDWQMDEESMQSYTILTIYALVGSRFQMQYVKKFVGQEAARPDDVIKFIIQRLDEFNVEFIGTDHGVGHKENQRLMANIPNGGQRVIEFEYVNMGREVKYYPPHRSYQLDRSRRMELLFEAIRQRWMWWPAWKQFEPYHKDIYGIVADYNIKMRKRQYIHKVPDDFFHSTLFAWEAFHLTNRGRYPNLWKQRLFETDYPEGGHI